MHAETVRRFLDDLRPAFHAGDPRAAEKTAEQSAVDLVIASYRAIVAGNAAAFADTLTDDIDLENIGPPGVPLVGRWCGKAAVMDAVRDNFGCVEEQQPEVQSVVAQGDTVVVFCREKGRFKATGREYRLSWVQIYTIRDGKIARFRQVFDTAGLMAAV